MGRPVPTTWSQQIRLILIGSGIRANQLTGRPAPHHKVTRGLMAWTKELIDTNPLMSSLLVICLGWCSNFVGSESGQKQSVKLLQNMVYSTIQHPPPPSHTHCCTFNLGRGRGGGRSERRKGATVHKYCSFVHGGNSSQAGSKIQTIEWMYLRSIKTVKHNATMAV